MEILGETGRERYWERYLSYFLDPTTPHDFGADLLNALLGAARPTAEVSIPTPVEPKNVRVTTQAQTATGPADILVYDPPSWFLCIELKIHASETNRQTVRYANASRIGDIETERYDRGEYVYLAPVSSGPPASERFTTLSWQTLVPYFESVLDSGTEYSERSRVQLSDFITTVRRELPMDDFTEFSDETRLYAEYADTIHSLTDAHEKDWRALYNNLVRTFYDDFDPLENSGSRRSRTRSATASSTSRGGTRSTTA
ncbi:hypothetical protein MBEHAL_1220 [Halarchaeum acidiphilum MH1-52-1]|uniref:Uncharacterized protein n=1 Tax=Halarchaeum acidiphilum MH1-52-1 TaxID=1261545 RepID=U2YTX9_9EURY|nr:hypothetical protein MBEHAL_1220 [Halarchaeum acidiphilum MH1-52-1]